MGINDDDDVKTDVNNGNKETGNAADNKDKGKGKQASDYTKNTEKEVTSDEGDSRVEGETVASELQLEDVIESTEDSNHQSVTKEIVVDDIIKNIVDPTIVPNLPTTNDDENHDENNHLVNSFENKNTEQIVETEMLNKEQGLHGAKDARARPLLLKIEKDTEELECKSSNSEKRDNDSAYQFSDEGSAISKRFREETGFGGAFQDAYPDNKDIVMHISEQEEDKDSMSKAGQNGIKRDLIEPLDSQLKEDYIDDQTKDGGEGTEEKTFQTVPLKKNKGENIDGSEYQEIDNGNGNQETVATTSEHEFEIGNSVKKIDIEKSMINRKDEVKNPELYILSGEVKSLGDRKIQNISKIDQLVSQTYLDSHEGLDYKQATRTQNVSTKTQDMVQNYQKADSCIVREVEETVNFMEDEKASEPVLLPSSPEPSVTYSRQNIATDKDTSSAIVTKPLDGTVANNKAKEADSENAGHPSNYEIASNQEKKVVKFGHKGFGFFVS